MEVGLLKIVHYILGKMVKLALLLLVLSFVSFLLVRLSPIDPVQSYVGADMMLVGPEQREQIAAYWGLDQSLMEQFMRWGASVFQGDLGTSMIYRAPVKDVIVERAVASLALMGDPRQDERDNRLILA